MFGRGGKGGVRGANWVPPCLQVRPLTAQSLAACLLPCVPHSGELSRAERSQGRSPHMLPLSFNMFCLHFALKFSLSDGHVE